MCLQKLALAITLASMKIPAFKIPTVPSIDLTKLDAQAVLNRLPHLPTERAKDLVKDAAYTTVGFGVLAFQKTQVRRQEIVSELKVKLPVLAKQAVTQVSAALTNLRGLVNNTKPSAE